MPRPVKTALKEQIRSLREQGHSVKEIAEAMSLTPNTVLYHLRTENTPDGRYKYTDEERRRLSLLDNEQLREEAQRQGRTFAALQRVAYRERKKQDRTHTTSQLDKIITRGWVDIGMESELKLVGLTGDDVAVCNRRLAVYHLRLEAPNRLVPLDGSGRYAPLTLAFQKAVITDTISTLTRHAARIKAAWRKE